MQDGVDLPGDLIEARIDLRLHEVEASIDGFEPTRHRVELPGDGDEPLVVAFEPGIERVESAEDLLLELVEDGEGEGLVRHGEMLLLSSESQRRHHHWRRRAEGERATSRDDASAA